jgi:hypothetical protein
LAAFPACLPGPDQHLPQAVILVSLPRVHFVELLAEAEVLPEGQAALQCSAVVIRAAFDFWQLQYSEK